MDTTRKPPPARIYRREAYPADGPGSTAMTHDEKKWANWSDGRDYVVHTGGTVRLFVGDITWREVPFNPADRAPEPDPADTDATTQRAIYCAPLAGYPGAYRVRAAEAEPFGEREAIITRAGGGWAVMWGLRPEGFWQHHATLPNPVDVDTAARAALDLMAGADKDQAALATQPTRLFLIYASGRVEEIDAEGDMVGDWSAPGIYERLVLAGFPLTRDDHAKTFDGIIDIGTDGTRVVAQTSDGPRDMGAASELFLDWFKGADAS